MNENLLITTSVVLVIAGMVTMNLTSTVWAQNDDESKSTSRFTMSQMINGKEYHANSNPDASTNSNPDASSNCDSNSQCGKTMKNVMGMMGNLFDATIP
jgi:hypothetical protein